MKQVSDPQRIAAEAEALLEALTDSSVPSIRPIRRKISTVIRLWPAQSVMQLARLLMQRPDVIPRWFSYELINQHPAALGSLRVGSLRRLGRGMSTWGDVDTFACYLSGPAWREGQVSDDVIHGWAKFKNLWWRRAALVSSVPLNCTARGGDCDAARTLAVCDLLVDDREDMVVKGMSWALRELSKKDSATVKQFLRHHADTLHSRVKREVANKVATGLKNPKTKRLLR